MTYHLYYMHLSKAQDYMDSMLWEQEAASSSLATPILQTHVDSVRIGVRFCFVVEIAGRISESVQKPRTLQGRFQKTEQPFFLFPPLLRD